MNKRVSIIDTDLSISPIGLGTVNAGVDWDGEEADKVINTYLDLGGNLIDSARVYADFVRVNGKIEIGRSERVIGEWIRKSGKRDQVVLITKGGHPTYVYPEKDDLHIPRMTDADMKHDIELSLKSLGTDYIDIYFYHRDNPAQSIEDEIETMENFRREGKIRYYGCSNWSVPRMEEAAAYAKKMGYRGFIADQALLNLGMKYMNPLADDTLVYMKDDLYQYHVDHPENLAMPYMGVASGFFHIFEAKGEEGVKNIPYATPKNIEIAKRCLELKEKYGATMTQIVLGFFTAQSFTCVPLYGPMNADHIKDAMGTLDISFDKKDYEF